MMMHSRRGGCVRSSSGRVILRKPHPARLAYFRVKSAVRQWWRRWDLEMIIMSLILSTAAFLKSFGYVT